MSIVVVPGQFHSPPNPVGKLASTLMSVAVAGMADPARFRKGKAYLAEHAVTRLEIEPGRLSATVNGSRPQPYVVEVLVDIMAPVDAPTPAALRLHLNRLTPEIEHLHVRCSCPDPELPCKHVVAALLALSNELVGRPNLLLHWRCEPTPEPGRAEVGARARGERHLRLAPPLPGGGAAARRDPTHPRNPSHPVYPGDSGEPEHPWDTPQWRTFLGSLPLPDLPEVPPDAAPTGRAMLGVINVGAVIGDALEVLRDD
jgi:hypothetical protein